VRSGAHERSGRLVLLACLLVSGLVMVGCTAGALPAASSSPTDSPATQSAVAATQSPAPQVVIRPGSVVDGFTLGAPVECSGFVGSVPPQVTGCAGAAALAATALNASAPGHAAIVATQAFLDAAEPAPIDVTGGASPSIPAAPGSGGATTVYVFTLADGSVRAMAVRCSDSGSCTAVSNPG